MTTLATHQLSPDEAWYQNVPERFHGPTAAETTRAAGPRRSDWRDGAGPQGSPEHFGADNRRREAFLA
jgi:hypothetical protein